MDNLKSLVLLWDNLAAGLEIPAIDRKSVRRRAFNEGLDFLTIHLPSLGKALDEYLISGVFPKDSFSQCRFKLYKDTGYPVVFRSLWQRIFGCDHDMIEPTDIKIVRQVTCLFYKLETPLDESIITSHTESFCSRDRSLQKDYTEETIILRRAKAWIHKVLSTNRGVIDPLSIQPRHGSGATACRTRPARKYHTFRYIPRLDEVYPYDEYFFYNVHHLSERYEDLANSVVEREPNARLVFVPKDSRGPRAICCEPLEFQYIQQGLMRKMYYHIENHSCAAGYINFTDQSKNVLLAKESSIDGNLGTLDLKEASDRVSWQLVKKLFPTNWVRSFDACRSRYIELPSGQTYGPLRKFSAMGSAVCFPVEALVFWALIKAALPEGVNVWVYGDDIILPTQYVDLAIATLEQHELLVNRQKSCFKTHFRESCGGDYFNGTDVGYVKFRKLISTSDISSWFNSIAFNQEIIDLWGCTVGVQMNRYLEKLYNRVTPYATTSTYTGVLTHPELNPLRNSIVFKSRFCKDLHYEQVKIPSEIPRTFVPEHAASNHRNEMLRYACLNDREAKQVGAYTARKRKTRWSFVTLY